MWKAEVLCHSKGTTHGRELISILATYPRFIHSEFLTHRDRARSSASSRAIPWKKYDKHGVLQQNCMYYQIKHNPFVPEFWGKEQSGMQSGEELTGQEREDAISEWLQARDLALEQADTLYEMGIHKSLVNRLTEPFMWISVIYTATEWKNFFRLRCHPAAEKHFQKIANMVRDAINASTPMILQPGELHTPFWDTQSASELAEAIDKGVLNSSLGYDFWKKRISAGRSCRISFMTHENKRDIFADIKTAATLIERSDDVIHAAALEHVATCHEDGNHRSGPFFGFHQFRKEFQNENVPG